MDKARTKTDDLERIAPALDVLASVCEEAGISIDGGKAKSGRPRRPEDRLNIPSSIVRASGFMPGDTVYALADDPAGKAAKPVMVLVTAKPANPLGEYRVSADGRIRITPAMLKKAGLDGDVFEFDGGEGKIVCVRQHNENESSRSWQGLAQVDRAGASGVWNPGISRFPGRGNSQSPINSLPTDY